ncbi:hypothetical protein F4781DRAFT_152763 [Annulohypoxylon bovei var. microspora]|nr:hypothetical protein F4781DRAFT_152763 [Annulohypoxylon bovei var. microspora]
MLSLQFLFRGVNEGNRNNAIRGEVLEGLGLLPYHERLSRFIRGSIKHWVKGGVTVVDFRPFYTVTIHHLQRQLTEQIRRIEKTNITDSQLEDIRNILRKYTDALRDFEFIHANRWNTHFVKDIAASRLDDGPGSSLQAALIRDHGLEADPTHRSLFQDSDILGSFDPNLMQHSTAIGRSLGREREETIMNIERLTRLHMTLKRLVFAVVGGLIIIVPMFILVVGHTTAKTLAVITTSILIFAIGVAVFSETEPENLLAATAAYAAVLVALMGGGNQGSLG